MNAQEKQDEMQLRIAACVNAFDGIPTERIEGKNLGEILAGEMRLHGAGPRADGGFGFEFSGGVCQLLAEAYADQFKQSGAINYLELLFQHSDVGPLTITMQRVEGLTPAQKLAQAEGERDALQVKLAELEKQEAAAWTSKANLDALKSEPGKTLEFMTRDKSIYSNPVPLFTRPAPAINLAPVSNCLSFFASVIKSGESWSATCQRDLDAAREALRDAQEAK